MHVCEREKEREIDRDTETVVRRERQKEIGSDKCTLCVARKQ